jgi:guanylate kinase
VRSILAAARLSRQRLVQLDNFVKDLQNQIDSL